MFVPPALHEERPALLVEGQRYPVGTMKLVQHSLTLSGGVPLEEQLALPNEAPTRRNRPGLVSPTSVNNRITVTRGGNRRCLAASRRVLREWRWRPTHLWIRSRL